MLRIDPNNGAVMFEDRIIGEYDDRTDVLILNMAWCRLAGIGLRVDGDTDDRRRVLLDRSNAGRSPEPKKRAAKTENTENKEDPDQLALEESKSETSDPWEKDPALASPANDDDLKPISIDF